MISLLGRLPGVLGSRLATHRWVAARKLSSDNSAYRNRTVLYYTTSLCIVFGGVSYAAVPLYRVFCQVTGIGGNAGLLRREDEDVGEKLKEMKPVKHRPLKVSFNADVASSLRWNFKPAQSSVTVRPGETVLAFYTAKNPMDRPVDGIATYTILPYEAGKYFNKIQCFCFEEQRLNPNEEVDMPVFFYIDPEFSEDPALERCREIILSYTFFESKPGFKVPMPDFSKKSP